jgi:hypothetical protein
MPSEEKNIMQLASLHSVYSGTVLRYGCCYLCIYGKLSGAIFFHMVPELDEEAFRNRKEDLDQDSLWFGEVKLVRGASPIAFAFQAMAWGRYSNATRESDTVCHYHYH